jgi:hypothetical protein
MEVGDRKTFNVKRSPFSSQELSFKSSSVGIKIVSQEVALINTTEIVYPSILDDPLTQTLLHTKE